MPTQIKKIGLANGVKPTGKKFNLSDLIQESYKVSYAAKKLNNKKLIDLTESHLVNIKKDPTNTKELSEDLDVLQGLTKLGKDQEIKDLEEVDTVPKKRRKRCVDSCVKPMDPVKESWKSSRNKMNKALKGFRESAKSKVFYKELDRFNKSISKKNPITMSESVSLYKACNSCLTHLTVELEKNPSFRKSYRECTRMLSKDNLKLLEAIQNNKLPSKSLLENFVTFTNILLESNAPEELDPEIYEDADMETLDDRDVINEDADMETLDDRDVIDEDEEISSDDSVSVDLTPEEISILKSILGKISTMQETEDPELVPDETSAPEMTDDTEDLEEEDELEEEDPEDSNPEDVPDEDLEEEDELEEEDPDTEDLEEEDSTTDSVESLENIKDQLDDVIEDVKDNELQEDDDTDEEDKELDFELSESAAKRIKKCF